MHVDLEMTEPLSLASNFARELPTVLQCKLSLLRQNWRHCEPIKGGANVARGDNIAWGGGKVGKQRLFGYSWFCLFVFCWCFKC